MFFTFYQLRELTEGSWLDVPNENPVMIKWDDKLGFVYPVTMLMSFIVPTTWTGN